MVLLRIYFIKFGIKEIHSKIMKLSFENYIIDLSKPIDISLSITSDGKNPIAWYQSQPEITPVKMGDWIGKVSEGKSSTNFNNIFLIHMHMEHIQSA